MIQIKLVTTCKKNKQQDVKVVLNCRPKGRRLGRPLKGPLDEADKGLQRPNW